MLTRVRRRGYSVRAFLVAAFVACAMLLGGGGSPNPTTEIILQLLFAMAALAWIWCGRVTRERAGSEFHSLAPLLVYIPLLVPLVHLIPLPPEVWTTLPGRDAQVAALALVGEESSWRPISQSPSRTLATLLAIIPPALCIYAVARLTPAEHRLILGVIATMTLANALLGMVQVISGPAAPNLYQRFHEGWVTGFQASRNAAADVLLIGFLAAAALVSPYVRGERRRLPLGLGRPPFLLLCAGAGLFLLAATIMTGSRSGAVLALIALGFAGAMFVPSLQHRQAIGRTPLLIAAAVPVLFATLVIALGQGPLKAVGRVLTRFSDQEGGRTHIWEDTWFAITQAWPVGVGMGGFQPAILAAERLEVVDATIPNRAHNDYLEIGLEAGLLGYAALAFAGATLLILLLTAWRRWAELRTNLLFAAGTLSIIALHSVVDYPMRAMAIACLAGVAAGMVAGSHNSNDPSASLSASRRR